MKAKTYLEKYTKIKSGFDKTIPFVATDAQKKIFDIIDNNDKIVLMSDNYQDRCSMIEYIIAITGSLYHKTVTEKGTTTVLIANKNSAKIISDIVRTFYVSTPENIRPKVEYRCRGKIYFPELSSCIFILDSTESLCGWKMNNVFVFDIFDNERHQELIMMSLESSVPIGGKIIVNEPPKDSIFCRACNDESWHCIKDF